MAEPVTELLIDISNRAKRHDRALKGAVVSDTFGMPAARVHDLESLFDGRYGGELTDDDAGREDFEILAVHVLGLKGDARRNLKRRQARFCPRMSSAELEDIRQQASREQPWSASDLGRMMRLTNDERKAYKITTIRPFDVTGEQLERERRDRWSGKKRAKRKRSRAEYLAEAAAKRADQKAKGVSRMTLYRRRKKMTGKHS
jgi:hypothetical protein